MRLRDLKLNKSEIARKMKVSEGTIRYHLKRALEGKTDGRKRKSSAVSGYQPVIESWVNEYADSPRRSTLLHLYENLVAFHGYTQGYDALRRYVRKHYPAVLRKGARLRIETPPGALMQIDWKESVAVQIGGIGRWVRIALFICALCFSRKTAVRVSERKDAASLIRCQQEGLRKMGGLPEYVRPDCMKTAVVKWNGERSVINEQYRKYMEKLGIKVFPARPGTPTDKGKIEKRIQDVMARLELSDRVFSSLTELQEYIDRTIENIERRWLCGATGATVEKSYEYEKGFLRPLPGIFPAIPVKELKTVVRRDGTVFFDGNYYQVGQEYSLKGVLCLHSGTKIHIFHGGEEIETYDHLPQAKGMVRLSRPAIESSSTPLSATVRSWALEVAERQVEYYEAIVGGGAP
jgi:transposase